MAQINKRMQMMQHLNNREKRACKAFLMLTHAFYCLPCDSSCEEAKSLLLDKRWECVEDFPRVHSVCADIEKVYWLQWCDEARTVGLR
jgi:hypothetical protein